LAGQTPCSEFFVITNYGTYYDWSIDEYDYFGNWVGMYAQSFGPNDDPAGEQQAADEANADCQQNITW
jgi:hypothetical protein